MSTKTQAFNQITQAEDYFAFFNLPYDAQFLNVNRLHILQKFSRMVREKGAIAPDLDDEVTFNRYREFLQEAYSLFQTSSPQEQKLFKVFNDKPKNVVLLSEIAME
ncbi:MAG: nitrogenase-stabilizing/protective protein NifW [Leptolyngbyaceae cyanobacterium SM2_5_2]|nr:nitrogenase-stabilizing/protective protein NifW [Leptolyngbyaceae cyanobacterium SM2_5_2]